MAQLIYLALAILIGVGSALQIAMVGAMSGERGATEATWTSLLGTVTGISVILAVRILLGDQVSLPAPFERLAVLLAVAATAGAGLVLTMRGLSPGYAATGLLALPFLVGAGTLAPRLGLGPYFAAIITGQMAGAVLFDHLGAFGAPVYRIDAARVAGVCALVVGVVLVKGVGAR